MTDDDYVLREQTWKLSIPVKFSLSSRSMSALHIDAPFPLILMVPRHSYLPIHYDRILEHFHSALLPGPSKRRMWFEYNANPLKWNLPMGVLFDSYCISNSRLKSNPKSSNTTMPQLPLDIIVHFSEIPTNIIPCHGIQTVKFSFFNSMKQALFMRYSSTKSIMNLPKADQNKLWEALVQCDYTMYWTIASSLTTKSDKKLRQLPLRIIIHNQPVIQYNIKYDEKNRERCTLRDILCSVLPQYRFLPLSPSYKNSNNKSLMQVNHNTSSEADETSDISTTTTGTVASTNLHAFVYVHGVLVPLDVPIDELINALSFADLFLYLSIVTVNHDDDTVSDYTNNNVGGEYSSEDTKVIDKTRF